MAKYDVLAPLTLPVGAVVQLSKSQAASRQHFLEAQGKAFKATSPIQFKAGESIGYEGELPKSIAALVAKQKGAANVAAPAETPEAE